jgi:outer membrane protein insertion porin family
MKLFIRLGGITLLLLSVLASPAWAQADFEKVAKIVITNIGPQAVSEDLIRANIHVKPGDLYIRASVDKDVLNLYSTGYFSNIRVDDKPTDQGVIITYILEGKLRLTSINFEGNTKFRRAKLLKKISSKINEPVDETKLFDDAQQIEKLYEKSGYTHTTVKYELVNIDREAGLEGVVFNIHESPKVRIVDVYFNGAHAFSQRKLRRVIKTRRHWMFSWITRSGIFKEEQFQDDQETLADFYRRAGYIDFDMKEPIITYPTPRTMRIEFVISEGPLYKVGSVNFKGNKIFKTDEIIQALKKQHEQNRSKAKIGVHGLEADVGMTFKPDALNHDIQAIEDFYGARGYIDVRQGSGLKVARIPNVETGTMDLEYQIDEGEKSYIEKILIKGNVKTKDKVIRRELSVSPGDVFDMVQVRLSKERVEGLGFFDKVDTKPEPTPDIPNHQNLIIGVDEKSTGQLTFGAGFNTVESLSAFAELQQNNFDLFNPPYFTGAGQKFRLKVQLGLLLQDYEAHFTEPWFMNHKLRLDVDLYRTVFNYLNLDNLYDVARTGGHVGLTRTLFGRDYFLGGVGYTLEDVGIVNVNTNAPTAILDESGHVLVSRFIGSLILDTRGGGELPNKGQKTALVSTTTIGGRNFEKLELTTSWYFKGFAQGHVLEIGGRAGVAQKLGSQDVPFYDRFYLGGQDSLRGFDFNGVGPRAVTQDGQLFEPIGGDTYWMGYVEYSIPIVGPLRLAAFYDIGNVSAQPWSNRGFDVTGTSFAAAPPPITVANGHPVVGNTGGFSDDYGIGIRLNIPRLGPLRLDYGIPLHHDPFNGSSGKFQFGVGFTRQL